MLLHSGFDQAKIEPWTAGLRTSFTTRKKVGFAAIRRLRRFHKSYAEVMQQYDVLVSPSVAAPAPPIGHLATDLPYETHYDRVRTFAAFTPLHNLAGAPAMSLPLGRTTTGLPLGVQFAASRGHDTLLLELAQTLEAALPWPHSAPPPTDNTGRVGSPSSDQMAAWPGAS
jgi:amidase